MNGHGSFVTTHGDRDLARVSHDLLALETDAPDARTTALGAHWARLGERLSARIAAQVHLLGHHTPSHI